MLSHILRSDRRLVGDNAIDWDDLRAEGQARAIRVCQQAGRGHIITVVQQFLQLCPFGYSAEGNYTMRAIAVFAAVMFFAQPAQAEVKTMTIAYDYEGTKLTGFLAYDA